MPNKYQLVNEMANDTLKELAELENVSLSLVRSDIDKIRNNE